MCENGEEILFLVFDGIMENSTHVCRIVCSVCTYMYIRGCCTHIIQVGM